MAPQAAKELAQKQIGSFIVAMHTSADNLHLYLSISKIIAPIIVAQESNPDEAGATAKPISQDPTPHPVIIFPSTDELYHFIGEYLGKGKYSKTAIHKALADLKDGTENLSIEIATGKAPQHGRDGRIVYLVKAWKKPKPGETVEFLDTKFIRSFDNVDVGTIVLRKYRPTKGSDGEDVFGAPVPALLGKEVELRFDDSLELLPAANNLPYDELRAKKLGCVDAGGSALTMKSHIEIDGDIDYRNGDIDFIGTVKIKGCVMKGFSVIARGDIEVGEHVIGGTVFSRNGNVLIKGNIMGDATEEVASGNASSGALRKNPNKQRPRILAKGSIQAFMVDDAEMEAEGNIEVQKDIRDSQIRTHGTVTIHEGSLLAGTCYAVKGVHGATLGSPHHSKINIIAASDVEASSLFAELNDNIDKHRAAKRLLKLYLGPYADEGVLLSQLDSSYREKISSMRTNLKQTSESLKQLLEKREQLLAQATVREAFVVEVQKRAYTGVVIEAEEAVFSTTETLIGPGTIRYDFQNKEFTVEGLKPYAHTAKADASNEEE